MKVHIIPAGRVEGSYEQERDYDCVIRSVSAVTGVSYADVVAHFAALGRKPGDPTSFITDHRNFEAFSHTFRLVPGPYPAIADLELPRNQNYLVSIEGEEVGHVAAIIDNTLWDTNPTVVEATPCCIWKVSPHPTVVGLKPKS